MIIIIHVFIPYIHLTHLSVLRIVAIAKYKPEGWGDNDGGGAGNIFNVRGPLRGPLRGNRSRSPSLHQPDSNGNYDTSNPDNSRSSSETTRQQHVVSNPYIVHWEEQDMELNDFIMAIDWGNVPEVERANALVETIGAWETEIKIFIQLVY